MDQRLFFLYFFISHITIVLSYPDGAPDNAGACKDLMPGHGFDPQTSVAPYKILFDNVNYTANENIDVTLMGDAGTAFKGFIIQCKLASDSSSDTTNYGSFTGGSDAKPTCQNNGGNTMTHTSRTDKTSVTLTWKAPATAVRNLRFVATFVQKRDTLWTKVYSSDLMGTEDAMTTVTTMTTTSMGLKTNVYNAMLLLALTFVASFSL